MPGGEFTIRGSNLGGEIRPDVLFGDALGAVVVGSGSLVIARVPDAPSYGELTVRRDGAVSNAYHCAIGILNFEFRNVKLRTGDFYIFVVPNGKNTLV